MKRNEVGEISIGTVVEILDEVLNEEHVLSQEMNNSFPDPDLKVPVMLMTPLQRCLQIGPDLNNKKKEKKKSVNLTMKPLSIPALGMSTYG
jgi:hypothetical protein